MYMCDSLTGSNLIAKLMKMQLMEEDDDLAYGASPDDEDKVMADGRPAWMRTLHTSVSTWMSLIPKVKDCLPFNMAYMFTCRNLRYIVVDK